MSGFGTHFKLGLLAALVAVPSVTYWLYSNGAVTATNELLVFAAIGFVSVVVLSTAPDVDVWSSIPRRYLGLVLTGVAMAAPIYLIYSDPALLHAVGGWVVVQLGLEGVPILLVGAAVVLVAALLAAKSIGYGLDEFISHRGILHSPWFAVASGLVVFAVVVYYSLVPTIAAVVLGVLAVGAVVVHLATDTVSSARP